MNPSVRTPASISSITTSYQRLKTAILSCLSMSVALSAIAEPAILTNFKQNPTTSRLPDFSYAGYRGGPNPPPTVAGPIFRVGDYGAIPNDGLDDIAAIQRAVDAAGAAGGGVVLFPAGTFNFDVSTRHKFVKIKSSNIVLRGAGSGTTGTIFHDHNYSTGPDPVNAMWKANWYPSFIQAGVYSPDNLNNDFDPATTAVFNVITGVSPAARNAKSVQVQSTTNLKVGGTYMLTQRDPDLSLARSLASPLTSFGSNHASTSGKFSYKFRQLVTISSISGTTITFDAPIRWELRSTWTPQLWTIPVIREIGVEDIRFKTNWKGPFVHHQNAEGDDGWNHVRFDWVENGWARNLIHDGCTMAVGLFNSKNCTVQNCKITGPMAHNGFNVVVASSNNLLRDLDGGTQFHTYQIQGYVNGNVFKNCIAGEPASLDSHGGFNLANLYDNVLGCVFRNGGSGLNVPPFAGHGTTGWNWQVGNRSPYSSTETVVFAEANKNPGFIHVGVRGRYGQTVQFRDTSNTLRSTNINETWGYVESIGTAVTPQSLYDEQRSFRLGGNTPPTVQITSPANGTTYNTPASVAVNATASDNGTVSKVEFYAGSTLIGTDSSSPYSVSWNNVVAGDYTLTAKATDNGGMEGNSNGVNISVYATGGSVNASKATQPASINLSTEGTSDWSHWGLSTASDWNHKSGITAQISNTSKIGTGTVNRFTDATMPASWTSGTPTASASGSTAGVFVAGTGNGFQITAPADGTVRVLKVYCGVWKAQGKLEVSLSDNSAPAVVDTTHGSTTGSANTMFTIRYASGTAGQKVTVKWTVQTSHDTAGQGTVGWQAATLTNETTTNPAPTVSITSPASGTTYNAPASVTISANAADSNGTVTKVDFLSGSTILGTDSTSPYSLAWNNVAAGMYSLSSKATDNGGAIGTSASVSITVNSSSSSNPAGSLTSSKATQPASVSLSTEGTRDWSHWGLNAATDWNHKSGITAQISNITKVGTGTVNRYTDGTSANSWSSGTPTASVTSTTAGIYVAGVNNGFQVTVPADQTLRTLRVYCGVWKSQGKLEATLSDGSSAALVDTSHGSTTGSANTMFTINYNAASAGQSLTVKWTVQTSHDTAGGGTVGWQAATLQ